MNTNANNNATANARACKCLVCGATGTTDTFHAVPLKNRGGRNGYLCEEHKGYNGDYSYYAKNEAYRGHASHGFTWSIELEMRRPTATMRGELAAHDFIPTRDCTVDCEFKSPIYGSLKPLAKKLNSIEELMIDGFGDIDESCGTHCHVGHKTWINENSMQSVRRYYHSLFVPLCEVMQEREDDTAALFGRKLGGWASEIGFWSNPLEHANYINVCHDKTIEYRICKMVTARQYMLAVKFATDATKAIVNNFITKFDSSDTAEARAHNKHKADVTAQKLIRLFDKYVAKVRELQD